MLNMEQKVVEVFKTNVNNALQAGQLVALLQQDLPECKINFDLEDCDRILRVEGYTVEVIPILLLLKKAGVSCAVLE